MAWTYIVECADRSYYVGSTTDLERRIWEHNQGIGARYTARRRPVKLVYAAEFSSVEEAYIWEKQIQGWGRAKREALIRDDYDALPELARKSFKRGEGNVGRVGAQRRIETKAQQSSVD